MRSVSRTKIPPSLRLIINAERSRLVHLGFIAIIPSQDRTFRMWAGFTWTCHSAVEPLTSGYWNPNKMVSSINVSTRGCLFWLKTSFAIVVMQSITALRNSCLPALFFNRAKTLLTNSSRFSFLFSLKAILRERLISLRELA